MKPGDLRVVMNPPNNYSIFVYPNSHVSFSKRKLEENEIFMVTGNEKVNSVVGRSYDGVQILTISGVFWSLRYMITERSRPL